MTRACRLQPPTVAIRRPPTEPTSESKVARVLIGAEKFAVVVRVGGGGLPPQRQRGCRARGRLAGVGGDARKHLEARVTSGTTDVEVAGEDQVAARGRVTVGQELFRGISHVE